MATIAEPLASSSKLQNAPKSENFVKEHAAEDPEEGLVEVRNGIAAVIGGGTAFVYAMYLGCAVVGDYMQNGLFALLSIVVTLALIIAGAMAAIKIVDYVAKHSD